MYLLRIMEDVETEIEQIGKKVVDTFILKGGKSRQNELFYVSLLVT